MEILLRGVDPTTRARAVATRGGTASDTGVAAPRGAGGQQQSHGVGWAQQRASSSGAQSVPLEYKEAVAASISSRPQHAGSEDAAGWNFHQQPQDQPRAQATCGAMPVMASFDITGGDLARANPPPLGATRDECCAACRAEPR